MRNHPWRPTHTHRGDANTLSALSCQSGDVAKYDLHWAGRVTFLNTADWAG